MIQEKKSIQISRSHLCLPQGKCMNYGLLVRTGACAGKNENSTVEAVDEDFFKGYLLGVRVGSDLACPAKT